MADKNEIKNAVRTLIDAAVSKANESVPGVMEVSDTGFNITIHVSKLEGQLNLYVDDCNDIYFDNLGDGKFERSGFAQLDDFHEDDAYKNDEHHTADDVAYELNERAINGSDLADDEALDAWGIVFPDGYVERAFNALRNLSYCGFTNITITFVA